MADMIEKSPCDGVLPVQIGAATLTEVDPGYMTSLAPYKGRKSALSKALKTAHGMALPAPNRATGKAGVRALWFGHETWLLMGPAPSDTLNGIAAQTDQSDGWAVMRLEGERAVEILARLTPVDLRSTQFRQGHTARTELAHMMASITRIGTKSYQIMVFRAFARTAVHEISEAMKSVAARY